jgi:hypothetical protein
MRPGWLVILGLLGWLGWKAWSFVRMARTPVERSLMVRGAMVGGLLAFLFLVGFVFMPMPFKLLFIIPSFLVGGTVAKAFRDARNRLREEPAARGNIEKMKRIN